MPENLKRFANGHRGGLLAAIITCSILLGVFGLLLILDVVADPYETHAFKMVLFFLALAAFAGLIWAILVRARHTAQTNFTCGLYGPARLAMIDGEVLAGGAYYKTLGIETTQSSLLSHGAGLVIVPVDDIANITCRTGGGKARLVLRSRNGSETMLPRFKFSAAARAELYTLTGWLAARVTDLTAGSMNTLADGKPCDQLPGFFAADSTAGIQMQPDVLGPGGVMKPNYGKGALGALLGALLGCAAWGLVGLAGYMSGWIGLLVVILSLYGFKQVAGRMDKKAACICLGISLVMILGANYLVYSASVADALSEYYYITTLDVLPVLLPTLGEVDLLGQFWSEYAMGAVLTLVFGLVEIASLSPKKNTAPVVVNAATGVPAGGAAAPAYPANTVPGAPVAYPAAGMPGADAVTVPVANGEAPAAPAPDIAYEVRYAGKNANASFILLMIFAAVFLLAGIGIGLACLSEDVTLAAVMMLIFCGMGVLYLGLGLYTKKRMKNFCIRYDTKTITLTKANGKGFTCPWNQVTALHLGFGSAFWSGAYQIVTPYGNIKFQAQMPGCDHLREFARAYAVNAMQ